MCHKICPWHPVLARCHPELGKSSNKWYGHGEKVSWGKADLEWGKVTTLLCYTPNSLLDLQAQHRVSQLCIQHRYYTACGFPWGKGPNVPLL